MPRETLLTLATFLLLLRLPDWMPQFKDYRVFDWSSIPRVLDFRARKQSASPVEEEQRRLKPDAASLENPVRLEGQLDSFYSALARLERGETSTVRILHYGDSPTTADMITADTRVLLQSRFGNAGHGYHLIAKPWAWYDHRGVRVEASGFSIAPATLTGEKDGWYGLGGVSFRGGAGAKAHFTLREPHQAFLLHYIPSAATVTVNGAPVDLSGGSGVYRVEGASTEYTVTVASGTARLLGVEFRGGRKGIQYDSLGLNGAYISVLAKMFNAAHWAERLKEASPDLVVINYGTNESVYARFVDTAFEKELRETVRRIRTALPNVSILVMSPMDRGERNSQGAINTVPALHRLVTIEQRVAADIGTGFFNTFLAMGGPGTMGRWYEAEPRLVGADFIHPMPNGAKIVGDLLYRALMEGYQRYRTQQMNQRYASGDAARLPVDSAGKGADGKMPAEKTGVSR